MVVFAAENSGSWVESRACGRADAGWDRSA